MNRFVVTKAQILHILSTLIFTPLSGFVATWSAKHLPGMPHFTASELNGVFIAGAASGLGTGIHYLHGWQVWERDVAPRLDVVDTGNAAKKPPKPADVPGV